MKKFVILILIGSFAILGWGCKKTDEQEQVNALENQVANEEASKEEPQVQVKDLAEDMLQEIPCAFNLYSADAVIPVSLCELPPPQLFYTGSLY